jgi:hypothetical protein
MVAKRRTLVPFGANMNGKFICSRSSLQGPQVNGKKYEKYNPSPKDGLYKESKRRMRRNGKRRE